jgi:hypothetical protein
MEKKEKPAKAAKAAKGKPAAPEPAKEERERRNSGDAPKDQRKGTFVVLVHSKICVPS